MLGMHILGADADVCEENLATASHQQLAAISLHAHVADKEDASIFGQQVVSRLTVVP